MAGLNDIVVTEHGIVCTFVSKPDPRPGYHTWKTAFDGVPIQFMYTPNSLTGGRDAHRTMASYPADHNKPNWWPGSRIMVFQRHMPHAAFIQTLILLRMAYLNGLTQGRADVKYEFRNLLGIKG